MIDRDVLHFVCLAVIDISAMMMNLILISAIIWGTPTTMRSFSIILLFTAVVDCVTALMSLLATTMVENLEGSIIYVYTGPCQHIHAQLCYVAHAFHAESIAESCVLLLISFSYRIWSFSSSIKSGSSSGSRMKLFIICVLASIPAVITTITYANSSLASPPPTLLEHPLLTGRIFSIFNISATHFMSTENILPRFSIGYIVCLYTAATPILFVLRRKLLQKILMLGSSTEKQSHHNILRSLTLQMLLPLSFSIAFTFWIIDFLGICRFEPFQRAILPVLCQLCIVYLQIMYWFIVSYGSTKQCYLDKYRTRLTRRQSRNAVSTTNVLSNADRGLFKLSPTLVLGLIYRIYRTTCKYVVSVTPLFMPKLISPQSIDDCCVFRRIDTFHVKYKLADEKVAIHLLHCNHSKKSLPIKNNHHEPINKL